VKEKHGGAYELPTFHVEMHQESQNINDLAQAIHERGWKLKEIRPVDMTLEEIFIKLVTQEEGM
jgi:hypothetical protein